MNRTEHNVRVVWLVVNRKSGVAVDAAASRRAARERRVDIDESWLDFRDKNEHKVVRCVVQETKRKGGGA